MTPTATIGLRRCLGLLVIASLLLPLAGCGSGAKGTGGSSSLSEGNGIAEELAVLRRARNPLRDEIPAYDLRELAGTVLSPRGGARLALSRRALGPRPSVWVVPTTRGVCVLADWTRPTSRTRHRALGVSCEPRALLREGDVLSIADTGDGTVSVAGVVPDGVRAVALEYPRPRRSELAVSQNVYETVVRGLASLSFDGPGGGIRQIATVGRAISSRRCRRIRRNAVCQAGERLAHRPSR